MSVLDKINNSSKSATPKNITWCEEDNHNLYEYFTDFNEWLDGDDGIDARMQYGLSGLTQASKAFFAGDFEAYNQAFISFQRDRLEQTLSKDYIIEKFGDNHWFEINSSRFEQLIKALEDNSVIPFIGAGLSVESGFPTWKKHLIQQGRTCGLDALLVKDLLDNGQYESVIEEIESKGYKDAFIQQIKDVFSKTGSITQTTLRLTELFTDTIITTNYDHILEQAFETGEGNNLQVLDSSNILVNPDFNKTTIIKLHGDIKNPTTCILSKNQYDEAYGYGALELSKPIPKLLSYHYRTSNFLFLGCSLNRDRTMEVFQTVKQTLEKEKRDIDIPQHFSLESMPETEAELASRNAYLLKYGITPIWFPKDSFDYIEQILRLARNELRYNGYAPGQKRFYLEPPEVQDKKAFLSGFKQAFQSLFDSVL